MKNFTPVRISVEEPKVHKIKKDLLNSGFHNISNELDNKRYLSKIFYNQQSYDAFINKCKRENIRYLKVNTDISRSSNYRQKYFSQFSENKRIFRCAYCGKLMFRKNVTVDHIIPVNKMKFSKFYKFIGFTLLRLKSVNNTRNLVSACKKCNSKKSDKGGLWIIRGFLGKHFFLRNIIRLAICFFFFWILIVVLKFVNIDLYNSMVSALQVKIKEIFGGI
jgi:hypothetical protein